MSITHTTPMDIFIAHYGGHWGEHPYWTAEDWAVEALQGETRLGYWEWVRAKLLEQEPNP